MQNGKSNIKDVFDGDKIFNVPKYQRSYIWVENNNLSDFLDDLENQIETKKYFLGTFLFHEKETRGDYEVIDIVDGQQRLTTFAIFVKVITKFLLEKKSTVVSKKTIRKFIRDEEVYKFEHSNDDNSFLHTYILGDKQYKRKKFDTPSQKRLLEAKTYFEKKFKTKSKSELESLFNKAIRSEVLLYVVHDISSATQIFELLNDRGRKLTSLESLKSFLMYTVGLNLKNSDQIIDDIQNDFSNIYRIIENNDINPDDVLRYHTIAFEKSSSAEYDNPKEFIKKKINKLLKIKNKPVNREIISYVSRLKDTFQHYADIKSNAYKIDSLDDLFMIGRIGPFYPLMLKIKKEKSKKEFDLLVQAIVRFTFRASLIGLRSNGESYLYNALRNNEDLTEYLKTIVDDNWWDINGRSEDTLENNYNFYGWVNKSMVKFILFKYENHLRDIKGFPNLSTNDFFSKDNRKKFSIEHITAQKAKNLKLTESFHENFMHSLGNLVIDSVASNSSKGNKPSGKKQKQYSNAPLMSQNELSKYNVQWSKIRSVKSFIKKRDQKLKEFITETWEIGV